MAIYEEAKTCENYFIILDKVDKMEKVGWKFPLNFNTLREPYFFSYFAPQTVLNFAMDLNK